MAHARQGEEDRAADLGLERREVRQAAAEAVGLPGPDDVDEDGSGGEAAEGYAPEEGWGDESDGGGTRRWGSADCEGGGGEVGREVARAGPLGRAG